MELLFGRGLKQSQDKQCGIHTIQSTLRAIWSPRTRQRTATMAAARGRSLPLGPSFTDSGAEIKPQRYNPRKLVWRQSQI